MKKKSKSERVVRKYGLLPLTSDIVFKRVFGIEAHKRVLVCLLNSILNGNPHITSVELDPTELIADRRDGKTVRLDILATTDQGVKIDIEMQCKNTDDNIFERIGFYDSKLQNKLISSGDSYGKMPSRILIWITNFIATPRKYCVNEINPAYLPNEEEPFEVASTKTRTIIVELPKVDITPRSWLSEMFFVWMDCIIHPESIPKAFFKIAEVKEALDELEEVSQDEEMREAYEARQKELNDFNSAVTNAKEKGIKEGIKAGIKEGIKEGIKAGIKEGIAKAEAEKIESAKNFLKMGLSIEQISQAMGLPIKKIEAIKKKIQ